MLDKWIKKKTTEKWKITKRNEASTSYYGGQRQQRTANGGNADSFISYINFISAIECFLY